MEIKVTVVYSSRFGHTRLLAEHFADGVRQEPGAEAELVTAGEALRRLDEFDRADAIALGSPTYMGNLSAEIKTFMEACSGRWASRAWSGKVAGGFTNSCNFSGDKLSTLYSLVTFAMQLGMTRSPDWASRSLEIQRPAAVSPSMPRTVSAPSGISGQAPGRMNS